MGVASDALERATQKRTNDAFKPWRWFAWTKWYDLAVLPAELCKQTSGEKFDCSGKLAEAGFASFIVPPDDAVRYGETHGQSSNNRKDENRNR